MERTSAIPHVGVRDDDLVDVVTTAGPFATVVIDTPAAVENAGPRNIEHWKTVRRSLAAQGAPDGVLDAIEALVPDAHLDGDVLGVVAAEHGVQLLEHGPEPEEHDLARWAPLPSLAPLVAWRQAGPPFVVVLADRTGADVFAIARGRTIAREAGAANDDRPVHKAKAGGWSERHHSQRVEETWKDNAEQTVDVVADVVLRVGAELVALAGDERAVQLVRDELPRELAERVVGVSGTRAADGSDDAFVRDIRRAVANAVASDTVALLRRYHEEKGQNDLAADGPEAVFDALRSAQVDVLLVHDDGDDARTAWFGAGPSQVALMRAELDGIADGATEARMIDVAVRAALGSGASVRVVPHTPYLTGGIGAILRWKG